MKNYKALAEQIVKHVGGSSNIQSVTNCMTRLRLVLKDPAKADTKALQALDGVQGVVEKGGQTQIVIGTDVANVKNEVAKLGSFEEGTAASGKKENWFNALVGTITAVFQPIIPAICGSGMIKAVLAICTACGWLGADSMIYTLLSMFADSVFYFMPIYLGFSMGKRLGLNPFVAASICACLIHPTFVTLQGAEDPILFFAMEIKKVSYASAVVPPLLIVWFLKYVDKLANRIMPNAVKIFMVPLLDFLIVCPLALIIIGPLGSFLGDGLYFFFDFLNNQARWVIPMLMGAFCPLFVMTGMHYSLMPVQLAQYASLGYGTLLGPGMLASNLAQAGASFAVALRTRDTKLRSTAVSAGTTALFGITEPALYGVTLPLKTPLWMVMIAGGIAGLWGGLTNMRTYASATAGVLALPVYAGGGLQNVINAVICIVIAFAAGFILTLIFGFRKQEDQPEPAAVSEETPEKKAEPLNVSYEILSPLKGHVLPLTQVPDEVFSRRIMGAGAAIDPQEGEIKAPFDGIVTAVFPTGHAIGLTSNDGVECLIHIGIDTVEMDGKGFETLVKQGQTVKAGDLLSRVDLDAIRKAGHPVITPVIITNSSNYVDVIETGKPEVLHGDPLMKVFR